jgi:translation initiation factor 3 subunit E
VQRQKYDLTQTLVPFLDRHLIFPLLQFLEQEDMYPAEDLTQAKYDLLRPTDMTDYIASLWKEIHDSDEIPVEFIEKREHVLATLQKLEEDSQKVLSVLEDQEVVSALRQDKTQNLQYLKEHHNV